MATGVSFAPITDIGKTQRGEIREKMDQEPSTSTKDVNLVVDDDMQEPETDKGNDENDLKESACLFFKCLLFVLLIGGLIAGIFIIAYKWKNNNDSVTLGGIEGDPVIKTECPDIVVGLRLNMSLKCSFTRRVWNGEQNSISVIYEPKSEDNKPDFICSQTANNITCIGPRAKCSNEGTVTLTTDQLDMTTTVTILGGYVSDAVMDINYENNVTTIRCTAKNSCKTQHLIVTSKTSRNVLGKQFSNCSYTYKDETGYTTYCQEIVPLDSLQPYGGKDLACELVDDRRNTINKKTFAFVNCSDAYDTSCVKVNCGQKDASNCTATCDILSKCINSSHAKYYNTSGDTSSSCTNVCYPPMCEHGDVIVTDMTSLYKNLC